MYPSRTDMTNAIRRFMPSARSILGFIPTSRHVFSIRALLWLACCLSACCIIMSEARADTIENQRAQASWYGTTAHGKTTANGETFNRYNLTVAHKKLPFGLVLRVKNLTNGRQVLVRVNDRGPYIEGRSLDVSRRAAIALRMLDSGVAPVSYEIISDRKGVLLNKKNAFYVHVTSVATQEKAKAKAEKLAELYQCSIVIIPSTSGNKTTHALCIGPYKSFRKAQSEFLRHENESVALRGIIEAPAKVEEKVAKATAGKQDELKKAANEKQAPLTAMPDFGSKASQALCSPSLHKSFELLDTALGTFFGIHAYQPALSFHYSVLTDCPDVSM